MDKKPKWEEEMFAPITPKDDIHCKTCKFKRPSVKIGDEIVERHTFAICKIYDDDERKPNDVLWEGAECEYYEPE